MRRTLAATLVMALALGGGLVGAQGADHGGATTYDCPDEAAVGHRRGGDRVWVVARDDSGRWVAVRSPDGPPVWVDVSNLSPDADLDDLPTWDCRFDPNDRVTTTADLLTTTTAALPTVPSTTAATTAPPTTSATTAPPTTTGPVRRVTVTSIAATPERIFPAGCPPDASQVTATVAGSELVEGAEARWRFTEAGLPGGWTDAGEVDVVDGAARFVVDDVPDPWGFLPTDPTRETPILVELRLDVEGYSVTTTVMLTLGWCP